MEKQNFALMEFGKLMREIFRIFKSRISELGEDDIKITHEQFGLLHAISIKEEDVIQKDMAEIMGKDKSAILRLIDSLEEKELVRRVTDKNDRRKNYIMVTKLGEKLIKQYLQLGDEIMLEIQQDLSPEEVHFFHKTVKRLKTRAEKL